MKTKQNILILLSLLCLSTWLSSCEKHDGVTYFKSKCEAEINGLHLIDQTRFNLLPGPVPNSPYLRVAENEAEFETKLSIKRGEFPLYYVQLEVFTDEPWQYLTEPQTIKYVNINDSDEDPSAWDYSRYCTEHRINYASILCTETLTHCIVTDGTFTITSYDKAKQHYNGTFTLQFSEGIMTGKFTIQ